MRNDRTFDCAVDAWLAVLLGAGLLADDAATAAGLAGSALFIAAILVGLVWPVHYSCARSASSCARDWCVRRVAPGRALWSSPALSLDRLRIDDGTRWLLVSPHDRRAFLAELRLRAPHLHPTSDGGLG